MIRRRFQNRQSRRLLDLKGHFTLIHTGGGTFVYAIPGRHHPIVGKIELGRKKYRSQGVRFLAFSGLLLGAMSVLSNVVATSISKGPDLNASLTPQELEQRSEELRARLLRGEAQNESKVPIIEHVVQNGETLQKLAIQYRIPAQMISVSSKLQEGLPLVPGQKLTVPGRPGIVYAVKTGDTLASVVEYYSVKLDDVIKNNPDLADLDLVPPGAKIFLPDAKIPIPPPVWMRPLWGFFTSGYGMRAHPVFAGQWQMHAGLDISAYYANVAASRNGQVSFAGYLGSYGNAIVIEHESGFKTLYAHLSKVYARAGQFVTAGSIIGVSGNTGFSTGPHLHFEIIKNGVAVNPQAFLR